jgi:DNA-binding response OmpR family regulator
MQMRLLARLLRQPGQVVSRAAIMRDVWDTSWSEDTRTLTVHISWLRRAIEPEPSRPRYLVTRRGHGYALHPDGTGQSVASGSAGSGR